MKLTKTIIIILLFVISFSSCYKEPTTYYDELDVTLTMYDKKFSERTDTNFQTYKTFVIRDSVGLISDYIHNDDSEWTKFYNDNGTSEKIIEAFKQKFIAKGYTPVDSLKNADFAINLVASLFKDEVYVGYPGYWYGWPGYYPCYGYCYWYKDASIKSSQVVNGVDYYYYDWWYGYYPWYGYGYSYSYETASIMAEIIDAKSLINYYQFVNDNKNNLDSIPQEDFPIVDYRWQAFLNGVLTYDADYGRERFIRGVDEAFTQSPYIYSSQN